MYLNYPYLNVYQCNQSYCYRTFNKLCSLKKHYSTAHSVGSCFLPIQNKISYARDDVTCGSSNYNLDKQNELKIHQEVGTINNEIVSFIAKLYSNSTLNRKVVQTVIEATQELLRKIFLHISEKKIDESSPSAFFSK